MQYFLKLLLLCFILVPSVSMSETTEAEVNRSIEVLKTSLDWRERLSAAIGLNEIPVDKRTDEVKKVLIEELINEDVRMKEGKMEECAPPEEGKEHCEDDEVMYYVWLEDIVSDMRDERAFQLFRQNGNTKALYKYGDKGMEVLLEYLEAAGECYEASAPLIFLEKALEQKDEDYVAKGAMRDKIKEALIKSLDKFKVPKKGSKWTGSQAMVCAGERGNIVKAMGHLAKGGDADVIPIIKSMAANDPHVRDFSKKKNYKGPKQRYFVREKAQKILDELEKKGIIKKEQNRVNDY